MAETSVIVGAVIVVVWAATVLMRELRNASRRSRTEVNELPALPSDALERTVRERLYRRHDGEGGPRSHPT